MKQYLIALLTVLAIVGMSSCKDDEPAPVPQDRSFVARYVQPQQILQCDTVIALPWSDYGKPHDERLFTMVTGPVTTAANNPEAFSAIALSKGDTGYTGTPFSDVASLSEPILAIKVIADEDISADIPKGTDMGTMLKMRIADIHDYVASGYEWVVSPASPGRAYKWYQGLVGDYKPEYGRMADPTSLSFSIGDKNLVQTLLERSGTSFAGCKVLVTLTFPSGDISASIYAYSLYAFSDL